MLLPRREWHPDTYWQRLGTLVAACLAYSLMLYSSRRLRPGAQRLAAAIPVLAFNFYAPLLFRRLPDPPPQRNDPRPDYSDSEIVSVVLVEFALTWLSNFKVLAWAANRGPLAIKNLSAWQFMSIQLAPITPVYGDTTGRGRQGEPAGGAAAMALAFAAKVALVVGALNLLRLDLPMIVREFIYTFGLYAILSFTMDGPAAVTSALLGMRVSPHFDAPWRSASLADFWSKRWDLAAGNVLRQLAYEPIMEGHMVRSPAPARRATRASAAAAGKLAYTRRLWGSTACFLVSGLMHELQFAYMTGSTSGGVMLAFFVAQVPLLIGERALGAVLRKRGWHVPTILKVAATLGTLLCVSHVTFWRACHDWGVSEGSIASLTKVVESNRELVMKGASLLGFR